MSSDTCWCLNGNNIEQCGVGSAPCGAAYLGIYNSQTGVQLCCASGSECGANSICKFDPHGTSGYSGYYLGGCTDSTFKDTLCRSDCNSRAQLGTQDIVYQPQLGVWSCCGKSSEGAVNCSGPITDFSFETDWTPSEFPGPVNQILTPAITTTRSSTSSTAATSTESILPTTSSAATTKTSRIAATSIPAASSGLSTGAKAGIGGGVALGGLAIIGLIVAVILLYRRTGIKKSVEHAGKLPSTMQENNGLGVRKMEQPNITIAYGAELDMPLAEADGGRNWQPQELYNTAAVHELHANVRS